MIRFLQEGGIYSWAVLSIALTAFGFALAHAFVARRWTLIAGLALLLLTLAVGFYGRQRGRQMVEAAVAGVAEEQVDAMMRVGHAQAERPLQLGLGAGGALLVPLAIGSVRMLRRRR